MKNKRKVKLSFTVHIEEGDEMIEREIKKFGGNAGHIIVPAKHVGKKTFIIVTDSIKGDVRGEKEKHQKIKNK